MNLDLVGRPVPWPPSARRGLRALPAALGFMLQGQFSKEQVASHEPYPLNPIPLARSERGRGCPRGCGGG